MLFFALFVLLIYIFSILFVRIRNRDRFGLSRQLSDFSTFMVPFNIPVYLLSKVPLTPFVDRKHFPELEILQSNWELIRDEALALYENGHIAIKNDLPASSFYKDNRWTSFYLKVYDCDIPSARKLAPKTMELIDQVPGMNLALFACLNSGKKLGKHHDPFALSLRYSLGLSTPNSKDCAISVDGQWHTWRDGESILFDETYAHHTHNDSDAPRIILMSDIDRPLKIKAVQMVYYYFARFFNSLFVVDNIDTSKTGIGNRITPIHAKYMAYIKKIKRWNRTVYKSLKILIVVLVGFLIYKSMV
ncbi:aspartyl/asparaginyl beta-hydroxylase domain-containing protein [Shewanella submarina]|uniref:Aspartyl/asparaginyl beta-hydroxylase domain-containing protein n=1 Tax=Shewanella submarina TaxID=2016376 RepID=A0ABV7GJ21_9GAMM|nr:aspartyl/asparaginyl beta-hydroxylase domain-containing protein [Shewanella submarina]MCL1036102.1 aspartyl/asparaginyl beta-hydroxylase domain-containing protein [Shewanella submarina]